MIKLNQANMFKTNRVRKLWLAFCLLCVSVLTMTSHASAEVTPQAVSFKAADGVTIFGQFYQAEQPKALILLFHQAGSNYAEYASIGPRLAQEGFSALAIDQRSGSTLFGRSNETVKTLGRSTTFLEAEKDLEAALVWAGTQKLPIAIWGSSYSSALVFLVAAKHTSEVHAVLAFSPGEYLGKPNLVQTNAAKLVLPIFATSSKEAEEIANAEKILKASPSLVKTQFVPKIAGVHGSSTLRSDRNPKGQQENWTAVLAFLNQVFK